MNNLKFALRSLAKNPGFTLLAVLTIAVAIGANTALFSIFDRLVLRPIDLPEAERLVRIWTNNKERNVVAPVMSVPKYETFRDQQTVFSGIAASGFSSQILTRAGAEPEQLTGLAATASFVPTLGMVLTRGRNFTAEEDARNGPPVCLIAFDVWKTRFGQRDAIVGETIMLNGISTTVVGVLPAQLSSPLAGTQIITPWPFSPPGLTTAQLRGGAGFLQVTARLKPGVSLEQAAAEVRRISQGYKQTNPGQLDANNENEVRTWIEEQVGPVRPTFILLLATVGCVLLIACANVSSLFLSRLSTRHKEIAIRLSIGATRGRLLWQFLLEAAVFCVLATGLGVLMAAWSLDGIVSVLANQLPPDTTFKLNAPTLLFTTALSVLATLVVGLLPALQASRVNLADVLKDTARGAPGGIRGARFRSTLIVAEVALSVVLLVGAGLLLASFVRLQSTAPGFQTKGRATAVVNLPAQRYPTKAQQSDFYYQVVEKLRSYPQVKAVSGALSPPIAGFSPRGVYAVEGQPIPPVSERPIAVLNFVTEDYFALLQIPLLTGRTVAPTDLEKSPGVCMINESFAKRLFPNSSALGRRLLRGQKADVPLEIVGIVADVKANGLNTPAPDILYLPVRQWGGSGLAFLAQTDGDAAALQPILRSAIAAVDKTLAIAFFTTLDNALAQSLGIQRITAWLTGVFAGVALLLSAVGLYGVLAYTVTQRTSEIGIRMALGADKGRVLSLILAQGMRLVGFGLILGLGVAAAGARLLTTQLYEVRPLDPLVFGSVTVLFIVVALLACLLPSLRASRVDPMIALRAE